MFEDYKTYPRQNISPTILWEYDTKASNWSWSDMAERVVQRVIQYGDKNDYYAMLQLYGGFDNVAEIVKRIPSLSDKDLNWACFLFHIKEEDTLCYTRKSLRKKLLGY